MAHPRRHPHASVAFVTLVLLSPIHVRSQTVPTAPREIPGITAEDRFPGGCVDCHLLYPEQDLDVRFATLLAEWAQAVDPALMAGVEASSPRGVVLEGRHPETRPVVLQNIPGSCIGCHTRRADSAPDMARLVHLVHLRAAPDNVFLTVFQGECTHCHKLDPASGVWTVPSGPERAPTG